MKHVPELCSRLDSVPPANINRKSDENNSDSFFYRAVLARRKLGKHGRRGPLALCAAGRSEHPPDGSGDALTALETGSGSNDLRAFDWR